MIKSAKDRNEEIFEHDPNKILEDKLKKFGNNWKKSKFNNIDRIIMASLLIGLIGIGINMPQIQAEYRNQKYPFMCGNASRLPDIKDNDILQKCKHLSFEVHYKYKNNIDFKDCPDWDTYNGWVQETFKRTHSILHHQGKKSRGVGIYILIRRI